MAYPELTPALFIAIKPQFSSVSPAVIQNYIDMASIFVDESWPEKLYEQAWSALTCHFMTLDGQGDDAESVDQLSGAAQYQSVKSGEVTLTRYQKAAAGTSYFDWLASTKCGAFYAMLLRMVKGGPRVVMGGVSAGSSPYAKDHLSGVYGWPGVYNG